MGVYSIAYFDIGTIFRVIEKVDVYAVPVIGSGYLSKLA